MGLGDIMLPSRTITMIMNINMEYRICNAVISYPIQYDFDIEYINMIMNISNIHIDIVKNCNDISRKR